MVKTFRGHRKSFYCIVQNTQVLWRVCFDKVNYTAFCVKCLTQGWIITVAVLFLLYFLVQYIWNFLRSFNLFKGILLTTVDLYDLASKSHGHHENLSRSITRRRWLVRVYAFEQLLKYPKQGGVIERNTFVIKVPPRFKIRCKLARYQKSSLCPYASLLHAPPTLGAPSHRTTSALAPPMCFFSTVRQSGLVMSPPFFSS